jgi:membrane-associated phospholipid phosphatase
LEKILDSGISVVLWFQQFSPTLDLPFQALTFLGDTEFFLVILPLMYWCIDRGSGARLLIVFLISSLINEAAKVIAAQPRPFHYDDRVKQLAEGQGGGFPSGHTQNSVVLWGYLAYQINKPLLWIISILLLIGIPLSRIYLGVHFPIDLLGGYAIGILLLVTCVRLAPAFESWVSAMKLPIQLGIALGVAVILLIIQPDKSYYWLTATGTFTGISIGVIFERHFLGFTAGGEAWKRVLRYVLGIIVLFGLWIGLRVGFKGLEPAGLFRFVRYVFVGLWGGLGAPWLFVKLGLAETIAPEIKGTQEEGHE